SVPRIITRKGILSPGEITKPDRKTLRSDTVLRIGRYAIRLQAGNLIVDGIKFHIGSELIPDEVFVKAKIVCRIQVESVEKGSARAQLQCAHAFRFDRCHIEILERVPVGHQRAQVIAYRGQSDQVVDPVNITQQNGAPHIVEKVLVRQGRVADARGE